MNDVIGAINGQISHPNWYGFDRIHNRQQCWSARHRESHIASRHKDLMQALNASFLSWTI